MKFQPEKSTAPLITAIDDSGIYVGTQCYAHSVVLGSRGEQWDWPVARFADLDALHFERLAHSQPELVIFGSGARLRFVHPRLLGSLMQARIGVETMDTPAACRTYNILASEGRHVIGAFLLETAD